MKSPDLALLLFGAFRAGIWTAATVYFLRKRNVLLPAGTALAALSSLVFAPLNAGFELPRGLVDAAGFTATPTAALICLGAATARLGVEFRFAGRGTRWWL